jgi:glycosyltransferase involved in cell wall biosynthesis
MKLALLAEHAGKTWLLSMARLHPKKGQDHLIRLWGKLPAEARRNAVLILAGPETFEGEKARLEALARTGPDADRVLFVGRTSDPVSWHVASDAFLSGSELEGMPLSPIEACGAGVPVVLSDIEGHRLLSGQARFFRWDDPADGARALTECLSELRSGDGDKLRERLAHNAENVRARFSITAMAGRYYELYSASV